MFKWLYKIGQQYRNPSISKWYFFLKNSEKWTIKELEIYQFQKLKELVEIAYNHSDYYKAIFDKNNLKTNDIATLEDIVKIPILEKDELLKLNKEIHTNKRFKKRFKAITSGSTGKSLSFYREESADSFNRASVMRGYSWYNVKPWDKNGYFWGFNFSFKDKIKTTFKDYLQNRFRIFNYQKETFNTFVKKLDKASYIHGYSSAIYHTAKLINQKNIPKPSGIKMVKGTSEKIFDSYQTEIKKAFGVKMISEYGATESGIIAFECKYGNMHVNMEGVLVEEVENELIITNLQMHSFPVIRYKLGDYIRLASREKECNCGMQHQILDEVTGRIGSDVYGKENVYPSFTFYYIFKNLDKKEKIQLNYQVIQKEKGKLTFKVEQKLPKFEAELLRKEIEKYFTNDIDFIIIDNQNLLSEGKKMKSFVSEIP
ncbi:MULTISPECIES: phenylacetate--CoA ligase family protein [Tenacibaculum]|uniref:phenylacetate--CoA ligase family protein n=1 Tax=Tenacibaculum TaxID=104267 RepID=UPI001F0B02B4|nr:MULTISPECIES: phenylacetate--CoA ligase family protein [Tenacibaculum]MCH3881957.1 phenylacetate--CoA ligase family protein [Tenacibaculum aquimarinum]MDO6600710.1 phenylacetate--CoA ligase family protein [Tenacibaculum sp. 1_MG-2023]